MLTTTQLSRRRLLALSASVTGALALSRPVSSAFAAENAANATMVAPTSLRPIRINFNENALGMSTKAIDAARAAVTQANRYAKAEISQLSRRLAEFSGVGSGQILLTAGSSEGIRATIEAFAGSDVQLVIPELTYGDGEHFAAISGLKIAKVAMAEHWSFDIEAMKKTVADYPGRSIVYLVNPNNPTATITPSDLIEPWINDRPARALFIVDEAYAEFVNDKRYRSALPMIQNGADNLIVLKTFSKIYAMAGMRIGYLLADERIVKRVANYVAGEKLNFPGVCAALAAIDDHDFVDYSKRATDLARTLFTDALDRLGIDYLPSQANFVFHRVKGDLADFQRHMNEANILVGRSFPPADGWCRTSLGTVDEMRYVVETLNAFRQKGWI
jgi:histidinol-phosphate aminotransferase